jgi:thiol-disulfide isomerase/thioredoxin
MAKYSKIKSKVHPIAYIIGAIFLAIIVVVIVVSVPKKSEQFYRDYFNAQIKDQNFNQESLITKDHVYKSTNVADLEKKIDSKELVIVYIGGTWCSSCLNEVAIYSSELEKNEELLAKAKNIYYLEKPETKDLKGLNEFAEKFELGELTYPTLLSFYNGKLVEAKYYPGGQTAKDIKTAVYLYYDKLLKEVK